MDTQTLPQALEAAFSVSAKPDAVCSAVLPAVCDVLQADRCFLHLRHPHIRIFNNLCYRRNPIVPDTSTGGWTKEIAWEQEDPLFAAALRLEPSIFVEDVETADPSVLNIEFESKYFGHRALIHAHICQDNLLWGILQPCVFDQPRVWGERDRAIIHATTTRLTPFVIQAVLSAEEK